MHVPAGNGGNFQMPEFRTNIAVHNPLEGFDRARAAALFEVLFDVAIEQIVDARSRAEGLTFARRIAAVHRHRLQDALGLCSGSIGGDLSVLADAEPAGAAVLVAIAHEIETPTARHDAYTEAGELIVVADEGACSSRLNALH